MKKIILCCFITIKCFSQDFQQSQLTNPNIIPPDVSSFQKVNSIPVSNYTGRANVDIPFYTIDFSGLKIPISLSYNTGGVKPNDVASSVGLNWSLNAGGVISKQIKGIDDFYNDYFLYQDDESGANTYYNCRVGYLSYLTKHISAYGGSRHETDDQPDIFNVNAPNLNFTYTHTRAKADIGWGPNYVVPFTQNSITGVNQNGQYINMTDNNPLDGAPFVLDTGNDYIIDEVYGNLSLGMYGHEDTNTGGGLNDRFWVDGAFQPNYTRFGINSVSIKNNNGFQYIFDKIDSSQYTFNRDPQSNHYITMANSPVCINYSTNVNLVAYHLSKIIDTKTGKSIDYQYETHSQSFSEMIDNYGINVNFQFEYRTCKGIWQKYPKLNRLKKIIFDEGSIVFNYNLLRQDLPGENALTEIVLYDNLNNQIKKAELNFEYFQSSIQQNSPYSKRLKLKEVAIKGLIASSPQKYKFSYNSTPLPLRALAVTDYFGYNNAYGNYFQYNFSTNQYSPTTPNPTVYFHPNKGQFSFLPIAIDASALPIIGNYSLESNINYSKAGILERIDYPTGGYTSFEYESNKFKINNVEINGGGLRIKEQNIFDGTNNRKLKFEYKNLDNTTSGAVASIGKFVDFQYNINGNAPLQSTLPSNLTYSQMNSYFGFTKYNSPKNNVELTSGCYVGYGRVKVYEENKGYTIYEYNNPSSHPNTQSDIVLANFSIPIYPSEYVNTNNYKKIYYDNGKLDLILDNDLFRGKLLSESIYDQQNTLLKETKYSYTEKFYKNLLLIKGLDNPIETEEGCGFAVSGNTDDCFSKQFMNLKQRRFLLSNIVEKEYFNGSYISKIKTIEYNNDYSLISKEFITDSVDNYRNEYYYPFDSFLQNDLGISNLNLNNRKFEKIVSYNFKNNEKIFEEKVHYNFFGNLTLPKQIKKYKGSATNNNINAINSLEITKRDLTGNILETTNEIGVKTSFIWGYNNTKIVARLENAPYNSISPTLISNIKSDSDAANESGLSAYFDTLRQTMPNALIKTYMYKPLVGISSITDEKKVKYTYIYDSLGRLSKVTENGNIVSVNEYNLIPQN